MEMRIFGSTGLRLSVLGFGCGAVGGLMVRGDPLDQERTIARAITAGVNYFDTAVQYGNGESEKILAASWGFFLLCALPGLSHSKVPAFRDGGRVNEAHYFVRRCRRRNSGLMVEKAVSPREGFDPRLAADHGQTVRSAGTTPGTSQELAASVIAIREVSQIR